MPEDFTNEAPPRVVALSAESAEELAALCRIAARAPFSYDFHKFTPRDAARAKFRRAAVASDEAEAAKTLLTPIEQSGAPKKLAFAFPGQGAAGAVPVAELRRVLPIFSKYLQIAEAAVERTAGASLTQILERGRNDTALAEHISVFAHGAALAFQYIDWGFRPDFILPHSLGEYAALAVSGMADFAETTQFVCRRALVIDSIKERGVMLHAETTLDFAEELASRHAAELSVAAVNGARSVVLSGTAKAARSAERALDAAKIPHRRLRVPYAAHSPLASQIAEKIAALPFPALNEPSCPVFSSIDGKPLTAAEVSRPPRRAEQCLRPARFDKALASARSFAQGAQITAVEFGVHRTLAGAGLAALPQSRWLGASSMKRYVANKPRGYCFRRGIMETAAELWEDAFADGLEWTKI